MSAPSLAIKVWLDAGESRWRINPALRAWSSPQGMTQQHWQGFASLLMSHCLPQAPAVDQRVMLCGVPLRATFHAVREGWLVWLTEITADEPHTASITPAAVASAAQLQATEPLLSGKLAQAVNLASVAVWRIDLATQCIELNDFGYRSNNVKPRLGGLPLDWVQG
jgi:hypothetical protein